MTSRAVRLGITSLICGLILSNIFLIEAFSSPFKAEAAFAVFHLGGVFLYVDEFMPNEIGKQWSQRNLLLIATVIWLLGFWDRYFAQSFGAFGAGMFLWNALRFAGVKSREEVVLTMVVADVFAAAFSHGAVVLVCMDPWACMFNVVVAVTSGFMFVGSLYIPTGETSPKSPRMKGDVIFRDSVVFAAALAPMFRIPFMAPMIAHPALAFAISRWGSVVGRAAGTALPTKIWTVALLAVVCGWLGCPVAESSIYALSFFSGLAASAAMTASEVTTNTPETIQLASRAFMMLFMTFTWSLIGGLAPQIVALIFLVFVVAIDLADNRRLQCM